MPTASQCQILGSIVKRTNNVAYVTADSSKEAEDVTEPPPPAPDLDRRARMRSQSAYAIPPYVRVAPEIATTLELPEQTTNVQDSSRKSNRLLYRSPTTAWVKESPAPVTEDKTLTSIRESEGRRRTLDPAGKGWGMRRHQQVKKSLSQEITDFQQERMDMVVQTLMPRGSNTEDPSANNTGKHDENSATALSYTVLQKVKHPEAEDMKTSGCPEDEEGEKDLAQPLLAFNSRVKVYDVIQNQLFRPTSQQEKNPDVSSAVVDTGGPGLEVFASGLVLPIDSQESLRTKLYNLGWRRPIKVKKKQKEKKDEEPDYSRKPYDLSNLSHYMDAKKDPVLRKAKKARAAPAQTKPPESNPNAVCFNILASAITHRDVWIAFKKDILTQHPEVRIKSIQFIPRAIFIKRPKGGDPIEDRWVITFTSEWFRNRVAGMDLDVGGGPVQLRRYDDIVNCEYRQFTRMNDYMKMVNMKK